AGRAGPGRHRADRPDVRGDGARLLGGHPAHRLLHLLLDDLPDADVPLLGRVLPPRPPAGVGRAGGLVHAAPPGGGADAGADADGRRRAGGVGGRVDRRRDRAAAPAAARPAAPPPRPLTPAFPGTLTPTLSLEGRGSGGEGSRARS